MKSASLQSSSAALAQDECDKNEGADNPQDDRHGHLEGRNDRPRQKISDRNKSDTGKTDPGKVLAKMITQSHRDQVGNDKSKERQGANVTTPVANAINPVAMRITR